MAVIIKKKDLNTALDSGQVRFIAEGDLRPEDVYEILQGAADVLADPNSGIKIDDLFDNEPKKVITHNSPKTVIQNLARTRV